MENKKQLIKNYINAKGLEWVAAALMEASCGYYTPSKAFSLIEDALERGISGFERTICLFNWDAEEEVIRACRVFESLPEDRQEHYLKVFKSLKGLSGIEETTASLCYPTMF